MQSMRRILCGVNKLFGIAKAKQARKACSREMSMLSVFVVFFYGMTRRPGLF